VMAIDHVHVFGRGANARCRECGVESNNGKLRRLKREQRQPEPTRPFDLYTALRGMGGFDHEGNME